MRGQGRHIINGLTCAFEKGDLFVLAPQDTHFFVFEQRCAICIIKFQQSFFEGNLQDKDFMTILKQLSAPLRKKVSGGKHQQMVSQLMELLISQHRKGGSGYQPLIIKNTLALVLALTAGEQGMVRAGITDEKIQSILLYVDESIPNKDQLKVETVAALFHISKNYFNQYFKRYTGVTYKKYVQDYTLQLIAQQLTRGNKTLKELAVTFGFTDESHLSNAFKAHFHQSPSSFRQKKGLV
jgi:AraC-like DNA-binding protein